MSKKTQEATKAWLEGLKNTGAIDEDQLKAFEDAMSKPEVENYVGETTMMRSDYSREQNRLQEDYQSKTAELQEYQRQLANWRGLTEKEVSQIKAEANQLRAERQRLVAVAQSFGLNEDDLGTPVAPFTTHPNLNNVNKVSDPPVNDIDPTKFLQKTEFEEMGAMYTLLPAEIADISAEHQELFKTPIKGMRQIVERAIKEKRSVRDVYEDEFKVAEKRAAIAEEQKEAEIRRRVEEELVRYRTEHPEVRIPSSNRGSFVLNKQNKDLLTPPEAQGDLPSDSVSAVRAAVAHWNQMDHGTED